MRIIYFLFITVLIACNSDEQEKKSTTDKDTSKTVTEKPTLLVPEKKIYANARFKDVTVERTGDYTFLIQGKGQIFEASFNWVVEDGHNELKEGYQMTDAGAPEWGNFRFTIDVKKERPNSTLTLILFETSAKDGSRVHELPIVLY